MKIYLISKDLKGEVTNAQYRDAVAIDSVFNSIENQPNMTRTGSGGGGGGKSTNSGIELIKKVDLASNKLFELVNTGQVIDEVTIIFARSIEKQLQEFMRLDLKNVVVSKVEHSCGDDDATISEFIHLNYGGMRQTYRQVKKGTAEPKGNIAEWSWVTNKADYSL